jgi:5-methylcytosine-specific restriction endonuclease McrA
LCAANFLSDDTDTSIVENLREARNKIKNISEGQLSDDLSQILEGCDLEIRATIACVEAYKNVNRDTTSRFQAIARGAEAKKPIKRAIEKLQTAAQRVDETEFDSTSPSPEIVYFLYQFEERFPYPIDELAAWRTEHEGQVSNNEWLDAVLPIDPDSIGGKPSYFEIKPDDSRSEEVWNRPTIDDEAIIQPTTRNSQKKHQQTAQQSIPEESPSSQAVSIRTNSNKDGTSDDRTTEVTPSTAPDNSSEANDTSRSDRTDADISQAESPPSIEKEETTKTTDAPQDVEPEPPTATEPSEPPSDSEDEAVDTSQTRVNTEIPSATAKLRKLRKQAEADATENPVKHTQSTSSGTQYQRSDKIREYALARADGQCEACGNAAPFDTPSGEPFLEVHHVDELGKGGADDPTLVVAICPNCHREVHYGEYGDELNEELRAKLEEGLGNVGAG